MQEVVSLSMSRLKREEHAISLEVWNARPYVPWEAGCVEPVQAAYADLSTKGFMTKIARQWGGYLIARHAPPLGLDKIYAEIRPDEPVFTGPPIKHYHGDAPPPDGLSERHVHSAKGMRLHIARDKFGDDHRGANSNLVHEHHDPAKYVFPPTPKVDKLWFHEHSRYKPEKRAKHLERYHPDGKDTDESHSHTSRVKDPEQDLAKRIDVHPLAAPKLAGAQVVFFVIEGCIKADAVLSAGAAVFSVPSVTLWDATELPEFAKHYLVNKLVVIVPDMDWSIKSEVITQARLCQTRLRRLGIRACIAAPPATAGYKGVDDFLAAEHQLDDLDVIDRQLNAVGMRFTRNDQLGRNTGVLMALVMHADSEGCISVPLRTLARIMGMGPKQVERALRQLESMNLVEIEGDLTINRRGWVSRSFYSNELDFEERPTTIVSDRIRAIDLPPIRLGDFLARSKSKVTQ